MPLAPVRRNVGRRGKVKGSKVIDYAKRPTAKQIKDYAPTLKQKKLARKNLLLGFKEELSKCNRNELIANAKQRRLKLKFSKMTNEQIIKAILKSVRIT